MTKKIKWTCPNCKNVNEQETHTDPSAHFPAMICEQCEYEIEDCLCEHTNYNLKYFKKQGQKGAIIANKKKFAGKSKAEISEMMRRVRRGEKQG